MSSVLMRAIRRSWEWHFEQPCGYCSPTQVGVLCFCPSEALCDGTSKCYAGQTEVPCECGDACGHGYFCHTQRDTCIDDADCGNQGTCNYDTVNKMWSCSVCWPVSIRF